MQTVTILVTGLWGKRVSNSFLGTRQRILQHDPQAIVILVTHKDSVQAIVSRIKALGSVRIVGAGHSFGCDWLTRFAVAFGLPIAAFAFADGVAKPLGSTLVVPANVAEFHSFRQTGPLISGSEISCSPSTRWVTDERVDAWHPGVDEIPAFQDLIFGLATA